MWEAAPTAETPRPALRRLMGTSAGSRPARSSAQLSEKDFRFYIMLVVARQDPRRGFRKKILCRQSPDKILDAPDLVDDYYLNLLDWCGRECAAKICAAAAGAKFSRVEHSRRNDRRDC